MKYQILFLCLTMVLALSVGGAAVWGQGQDSPGEIESASDQSCENIPEPSSGEQETCCDCILGVWICDIIRRAQSSGSEANEQNEDPQSPLGVKLAMSQGYSATIDSGTSGLGAAPGATG